MFAGIKWINNFFMALTNFLKSLRAQKENIKLYCLNYNKLKLSFILTMAVDLKKLQGKKHFTHLRNFGGITVYSSNPFSKESALELLIKFQQKANQREKNQGKFEKMISEQQQRTHFYFLLYYL